MFGWLLPKEGAFFDYFGNVSSHLFEACEVLIALTKGQISVEAASVKISQLEKKADKVTHQCIESLHKTFITPLERDAIFNMIGGLDDVLDFIEEVSSGMETYKLTQMTHDVNRMAEILFKSVKELDKAVKGLRSMKEIAEMRASCQNIHRFENEGDDAFRQALGRLFDEEKDLRNLIKWKEIYENLENAIDRCRDVSNIIEGVILEST